MKNMVKDDDDECEKPFFVPMFLHCIIIIIIVTVFIFFLSTKNIWAKPTLNKTNKKREKNRASHPKASKQKGLSPKQKQNTIKYKKIDHVT